MRIGIVGGGQLARMLAQSARPLGIACAVLDRGPACAASHVAAQIVGDYDDPVCLRQLADCSDVITFEFENVPVAPLQAVAASAPIRPSLDALATAQDRLSEKMLFRALNIDTPHFEAVFSEESLRDAIVAIGLPAVLKTRRMGYDGKGQAVIRRDADADAAWEAVGRTPCILETLVPFDRELSVVAARSIDGAMAIYPLVENVHEAGILRTSTAPAPGASRDLVDTAAQYLTALMNQFDYVGVMALELFACDGRLLANEFAPRVHNSAHWTIEGAACSQFENHVRAVLGLPLGDTSCPRHSAMFNLIGSPPPLAAMLEIPGAHVHLYEKVAKPGRKVGHVTVCADTATALARAAAPLRRLLSHPFP